MRLLMRAHARAANGTRVELDKAQLTAQIGIQPRDLRALEFSRQQSAILVRPSSIIVNLGHVKAVVRHNAALLFDPVHPAVQEFIYDLQWRLSEVLARRERLPYEFCVIEEILVCVVRAAVWTARASARAGRAARPLTRGSGRRRSWHRSISDTARSSGRCGSKLRVWLP